MTVTRTNVSRRTDLRQAVAAACTVLAVAAAPCLRGAEQANPLPLIPGQVAEEPTAPPVDPAQVVVTVEDAKLTQGEVDAQIARMLAGRGMRNVPPDQMARIRPMVQPNIVKGFIATTLLARECERRKIEVAPAEIDKALTELKGRVPPGASFEKLLEQNGTTLEALRQDISRGLRIDKLVEQLTADKVKITDAAVQAEYEKSKERFTEPEQVHARHILLKVEDGADAPAKAARKGAAEAIRKQLAEGADFAALAKEKSDCPSREEGGDLGTFPKGKMVKEFEDAAFSQKVNDVGPVVETKFGYHIIQVLEHTEAKARTLAEAKDEITAGLRQGAQRDVLMAYVDDLQKAARIVYPEGATAEPAAPGADQKAKPAKP